MLTVHRSSSEQVWTGLQWWPSDVSSREGGMSEVWCLGRGSGGRNPGLTCGEYRYPTMYPIPSYMWCSFPSYSPGPEQNDITFSQLRSALESSLFAILLLFAGWTLRYGTRLKLFHPVVLSFILFYLVTISVQIRLIKFVKTNGLKNKG